MKIEIELLSDMCTSDGSSYNSLVDTEVCYDEYGFPYIPAKRLKGCIREACLELVDWGVVTRSEYDLLFGKEGFEHGAVILSNGKLKDYRKYKDSLLKGKQNRDESAYGAQNVLEYYTYLRSQTALDASGVALKNSLRTIRVIRKGLVFEAEVVLENAKLYQALKKAVESVSHMGLNRTRGLGLVALSIKENTSDASVWKYEIPKDLTGTCKIEYKIHLDSPMLLQLSAARNGDSIEGGKILGLLAGKLLEKDGSFPLNQIICSNALISNDNQRYTPMAASIFKKKDDVYEENQLTAYDLLCEQTEEDSDLQKTPIGGYINDKRETVAVKSKIQYHHRRPDDKSIGYANGKQGSAFYQLHVLEEGQEFQGYIMADAQFVKPIVEILEENHHTRMGQSKRTEYGQVTLEILPDGIKQVNTEVKKVNDFAFKLNAPMILYNQYGVSSTKDEDLKNALQAVLGCDGKQISIVDSYKSYTQISGFNTTWHRRKPVQNVLNQGSVYHIHINGEPVDISPLSNIHLGERISEGYGEIELTALAAKQSITKSHHDAVTILGDIDEEFLENLCIQQNKKKVKKCAIDLAKKVKDADKLPLMPTIAKLMRINEDQDTFAAFERQAAQIVQEQKNQSMQNVLKYVKQDDDAKQYINNSAYYTLFMQTYIAQLKYLRHEENKKNERAEGGGDL